MFLRQIKAILKKGFEFNSVFGMGKMNDARVNFTAPATVETAGASGALALTPVANGKLVSKTKDTDGTFKKADIKIGDKFCTITVGAGGANVYTDVADGTTTVTIAKDDKVVYFAEEFQMDHVPATDIPTIGPVMEHIALVAEPRRIAVKYDQITAFQAKTDYGFSLDKQIAEQACGELAYEIDTEIVDMLREGAKEGTSKDELDELTWAKQLPVGVSKFEHYNGFLEVVEAAKAILYNRTQKFHPNYMIIASDVLRVLRFVNGYTPVKTAKMNGPYKVGELDGLAVYVSPRLESGEFFFGLNGNDMMSSAGVYAPYMAIVPTQLLGTPDGGLAQGFSTWYAKALLNTNLLVAGKIV